MTIPPQSYNLMIANPSRIHTCAHCARIIYYKPPEPQPEDDAPGPDPDEEIAAAEETGAPEEAPDTGSDGETAAANPA